MRNRIPHKVNVLRSRLGLPRMGPGFKPRMKYREVPFRDQPRADRQRYMNIRTRMDVHQFIVAGIIPNRAGYADRIAWMTQGKARWSAVGAS